MTQRAPLHLFAVAAGMSFLLMAAVHATHGDFDSQFTSAVDYVNELSFLAALVCSVPALVLLHRRWHAPRRPVIVAAAGQALLAVGIVAGLALGEAPDWFMALGAPGLLATLVGTVWLAVWNWRARVLPRWASVALALIVPAGIVASSVGGGIVPAALWLYAGFRAASMRL